MKRTFNLLLFLFFCFYLQEGYRIYLAPKDMDSAEKLSAIAQSVSTIKLENSKNLDLENISKLQKQKDRLFLLIEGVVYQFSTNGKYINCIELENDGRFIADFVVDSTNNQIIAVDNNKEALYYDFTGNQLGNIVIPIDASWLKAGKLSFYNDSLYTVASRVVDNGTERKIEQWLYRLNISFQQIDCHKLSCRNFGRTQLDYALSPELAIANNRPYVCYQPEKAKYLHLDSLTIINSNEPDFTNMLPLRVTSRFLMANNYTREGGSRNFFFYYDKEQNRSVAVKEGLEDDFNQTGRIADLKFMDIENKEMYYCRRTEINDSILYIVKLKA